jgi:hypothetical protein
MKNNSWKICSFVPHNGICFEILPTNSYISLIFYSYCEVWIRKFVLDQVEIEYFYSCRIILAE